MSEFISIRLSDGDRWLKTIRLLRDKMSLTQDHCLDNADLETDNDAEIVFFRKDIVLGIAILQHCPPSGSDSSQERENQDRVPTLPVMIHISATPIKMAVSSDFIFSRIIEHLLNRLGPFQVVSVKGLFMTGFNWIYSNSTRLYTVSKSNPAEIDSKSNSALTVQNRIATSPDKSLSTAVTKAKKDNNSDAIKNQSRSRQVKAKGPKYANNQANCTAQIDQLTIGQNGSLVLPKNPTPVAKKSRAKPKKENGADVKKIPQPRRNKSKELDIVETSPDITTQLSQLTISVSSTEPNVPEPSKPRRQLRKAPLVPIQLESDTDN